MKEHGRAFQCEPCRQTIIFFAVSDASPHIAAGACFRGWNARPRLSSTHDRSGMTILTDDPGWKPDVYEARALAVTFVSRYGHAVQGGHQATGNGLTVTYHPDRSPMRLTVDATGDRVLSLEWKRGDAWRMKIETYHTGRWQSRLNAAAHPRPWLERCRALVTFTGTLPKQRLEKSSAQV